MKKTLKGALASVTMLVATGLMAQPESWRQIDIPGDSTVVGMGEVTYPDGARAVWVSNAAGSFRRIEGQWQPWPVIDGENPVVRDILVAPDENGLTSWWLATPNGLWRTGDGQAWKHHTEVDTTLLDRDIFTLHLSQNSTGQPEVWIGSQTGLTIWSMGQWMAVPARSDGFQGGAVTAIRSLLHNGRRQIWVAGPTGLSRHADNRWQRWAAECLRGHRLNAIETLETSTGMILLAASDRGLRQLSLDDPTACQALSGPDGPLAGANELARDRYERLHVFSTSRVERFSSTREGDDQWHWTFFDQRDGLAENIEWRGGQRLDADGRIWAGSTTGLWIFEPAQPPAAPARPPAVLLAHGQQEVAADADSPLRFSEATPALRALYSPDRREHVVRYRHQLMPSAAFGPWQYDSELNVGPLGYGKHRLLVEVADEFGRIHGPYDFALERSLPMSAIIGLISLLLLLLGAAVLVIRRSVRN